MRLFVFFTALVLANTVHALSPSKNARALREKIIVNGNILKAAAREEFRLPVSRGFHQHDTSLCWVYSFLNAQETLYRVSHPGSTLELSRAAFQYRTMEDRMLRHARRSADTPNMVKESGTPVDAWALGRSHGLIAFADYRDILTSWMVPTYQVVAIAVARAETPQEQEVLLIAELERLFGALPSATHLGGRTLSPLELCQEVMGDQEWVSYAPGTQEALGPHADSDARPGAQSFYTSAANIKRHIYESLKAGKPVNYTANGHVVLIYGGAYDANGRPLRFYIKDSYEPFLYNAEAGKLLRELVEITVLK